MLLYYTYFTVYMAKTISSICKIYFYYSGQYAPIDASDAGGMNLLDLNTMYWSQKCLDVSLRLLQQLIILHIKDSKCLFLVIIIKMSLLQACGDDLRNKLGSPVPSQTDIGPISKYMTERYGFLDTCRVIAFTGDNPR